MSEIKRQKYQQRLATDPSGVRAMNNLYADRWRNKNRTVMRERERERDKRLRRENPSQVRASDRQTYLKYAAWKSLCARLNKRNLTLDQFHAKLESQDFCCAICGGDMLGYKNEHIDHDHVTQKARGILCSRCNLGLGHFSDSHRNLTSAARYLRVHES